MNRRYLIALLAALTMGATFNALAAIDVNKATQAELEAIRGVGPALSGRILAERQKGPFKNWDDMIGRVRGVGPGSAQRLSKAGLTVGVAEFKPAAK